MIERRDFLGYSLAAVSAGAPASAASDGRLDHAVTLGRRVLGEGHLPADPALLRAELDAGQAPVQALFARDWQARIAGDFGAQRMIPANGWSLSRTEAALCALAALEAGGLA